MLSPQPPETQPPVADTVADNGPKSGPRGRFKGPIYRLMKIGWEIGPILRHRQAWHWPQMLKAGPQKGPENKGQFVPKLALRQPAQPIF